MEANNMGDFLNPDKIINEFGVIEGMMIGDFGAGTGFFPVLFGQRVGEDGKVYAVDIQTSALESVESKARAANLENIETIHADLEVLGGTKLQDSVLDMVVLINILFQSQKKSEILKEAHRVLKGSGALVLIDWKKGVSGLGPPDELRIDEMAMRALLVGAGFAFDRSINAGKFHYGIIFKK